MVPLKPNELRRDAQRQSLPSSHRPTRAAASTGIQNDECFVDTIDDRWAFNLRVAFLTRR